MNLLKIFIVKIKKIILLLIGMMIIKKLLLKKIKILLLKLFKIIWNNPIVFLALSYNIIKITINIIFILRLALLCNNLISLFKIKLCICKTRVIYHIINKKLMK